MRGSNLPPAGRSAADENSVDEDQISELMNTVAESSPQPTPNATRPRHILVPVDFSKPCLHGVAAALEFARRFGAKLTLLHVVKHLPRGSHVVLEAIDIQQDWTKPARERLAEFVAAHVPADVAVEQVVAEGKPFHEVVKLAAGVACDLIIISTHGYTGLAHVLIGSNAERIVQHAPCPVLVVRGRPDASARPVAQPLAFRWVMVPTDFSENSLKALPLAGAVAREYGATLKLVHARTPLWVPDEIIYVNIEKDLAVLRAKADIRLHEIRSKRLPSDLTTETAVLDGDVHQMICEAAKSEEPGLIVMATHGLTGWKHALIGSTAERVVRHAPCPVLVVR